jgi:hypothetical protein
VLVLLRDRLAGRRGPPPTKAAAIAEEGPSSRAA